MFALSRRRGLDPSRFHVMLTTITGAVLMIVAAAGWVR